MPLVECEDCLSSLVSEIMNFLFIVPYGTPPLQGLQSVGAGTRGEFREEDQMLAVPWIAEAA